MRNHSIFTTAALVLLTACANARNTPIQEWVRERFNECRVKTNARVITLMRVTSDGTYWVAGADDIPGEWARIQTCMRENFESERSRRDEAAKRPGRITSGVSYTTVEYRVSGRTAMTVLASVNGTDNLKMLVDTGASMTMVSPKLAKGIGIDTDHPVGNDLVVVAGGKTIWVPMVRVHSVKVGDALAEEMEIGLLENEGFDGILGEDFLHRFQLTIDRVGKHLTLQELPP